MGKKRAMTSEKARSVKKRGHEDEKEFAELIGAGYQYQNGQTDKKDVIDMNGDTHSVKSGDTRWQVFLYGMKRFQEDKIFKVMGGIGDGIGDLIYSCLNCYPISHSTYEEEKENTKQMLQSRMLALCGKLQNDDVFAAFLSKSIFNCGEVIYLTIKQNNKFHVFWNKDVVDILKDNLKRETSIARANNQTNYQKVTFVLNDRQAGTIEIRHDSNKHSRQAVFCLDKELVFNLLSNGFDCEEWGDRVVVYGNAIKKFQKNHKDYLIKKASISEND